MPTTPLNDQPPPRPLRKRAVVGMLLLTTGVMALALLLYPGIQNARISAIRLTDQ